MWLRLMIFLKNAYSKLCKIAAQDYPQACSAARKAWIFPTTLHRCRKKKTGVYYLTCTSMQACSFRHFHYVFRSSTLHSKSYIHTPAVSTPRKRWFHFVSHQISTRIRWLVLFCHVCQQSCLCTLQTLQSSVSVFIRIKSTLTSDIFPHLVS